MCTGGGLYGGLYSGLLQGLIEGGVRSLDYSSCEGAFILRKMRFVFCISSASTSALNPKAYERQHVTGCGATALSGSPGYQTKRSTAALTLMWI